MLALRDDAPTRTIPWATYALIVINIVVFLFIEPAGFQSGDADREPSPQVTEFTYKWAAVPCEFAERKSLSDGAKCTGEHERNPRLPAKKNIWPTLVTHMFLHGSLIHLLGNMLFLWVFGNNVEDRFGPWPFLGLYLGSGLVAMFGHAAFHWNDAIPMLGASGAIAGLLGAYLVLRPRGRVLVVTAAGAPQVVYVPAWTVLGLFFLEQFFIDDASGVAWMAHAAGMTAGALLTIPMMRFLAEPEIPRFGGPSNQLPQVTLPDSPPTS